MKSIAFFLTSASLMLLLFIGCTNEIQDEIPESFILSLDDVTQQTNSARHIEGELETHTTINLSEYEIYIPELISVSPNGTIGVFDYSQMKMNLTRIMH